MIYLRALSVAFALGVLVAAGAPMSAADLRGVLTDYTITSWSQREGLPDGNVWALAQDLDGYLWVGSDGGLLRFDGVRFTSKPTGDSGRQKPVRALHAARDGSIWVGYGNAGGLARIRPDGIRTFGEAEGVPGAAFMVVIEDLAGVIWAGGEKGLFSFADGRWQHVGAAQGLPEAAVYSAYVDQSGRFYVGTATGILRRQPGESSFTQLEVIDADTEEPTEAGLVGRFQRSFTEDAAGRVPAIVGGFPRSFVQDATGRLLVNDWTAGFHVVGSAQLPFDLDERGRGYRLLLDRRGNLWVGTIGQGLWRIRPRRPSGFQSERASSLTGLLSDGVGALLEDKDGNIWAGTTEGLNRLTPRRVSQLTDQGFVVGIEMTPDNNVWVGTDDALSRFSPGDSESPSLRVPLSGSRLRTMHADERGTIWVATDRYVARMPGGTTRLSPLSAGPLSQIDLIASDFAGGVWLYDQNQVLGRWVRGAVSRVPLPPEFGDVRIKVLYTDRRGQLWAALADGRVAIRDRSGTFKVYGPADGLGGGTCRQIFEDDEGAVWLAAIGGLSRFANGRFVTVRSDRGFPVSDLTAIAEDDVHTLWIGTGFGLLRVSRHDFDEVAAGRSTGIPYSSYDRSDGLAGLPHAYNNNRRVVRASDGRLWFVTSRGLSVIDPRAFRDAPARHPITVEYVTADETRMEIANGLRLPARTTRVEIAYSELNLSSPLRTRFLYRLDGFDADWVDAGTRRTAFYTNLPPRQYTFRVVASAPDGTWVEPGAAIDFAIAPMFYQTSWFTAGAVVALALAVWGVWLLRLRQIRGQFALVLGERVRLSRELHDTLLQGLVGVALQFDAIAADVETNSPGMQRSFVRMRKQIEEYIREARQSIVDLRSQPLRRRDLVASLRDAGEHLTADRAIRFEFSVCGTVRRFPRKIEDELLRIGQEAVNNAVRHADPTLIRVELAYTDTAVTLQVNDDGRGFDHGLLTEAAAEHYGLISMRERAEEIGASLEIASRVNFGTNIRAIVPMAA
ncbi:MAG: two-component regulator propeller domain-containing protein [Vicinamibacterales bacterium]